MTVAEQIGRNLSKARRRACMSQLDLARRAGLHYTEIGVLERGLRVPRIDTALKISESAGADPGDFFEGIAWHEPARFDEDGWFTIVGLHEPVDLRPPRAGGKDR